MNRTSSSALIGRNGFSALVFTQFLGAFNDNLYKMIVSLLAVGTAINVGGAGAYLSAAGAVFILPYLLFSGYAGFVSDAFDKRSVLVVTKVIEIGIMVLALVALVAGRIELLLAILFLMAVQSTFFSPAKYGILPEILPAMVLARANGVLELSRYAAVILGTVAGGALLAQFSDRPVYIGAVLIAVSCIGAITSLRIDFVPRSGSCKRFRVNPWTEIVAGSRRLTRDRKLGPAVAGITFFEFLGAFVLLDVLLIGKEMMALDDLSTSLLGAFAGIGIGLGALTAGKLSRNGIEIGLAPIGGVGVSAVLLVTGCATLTYPELAVGISLTGFFGGLIFVPLNTLLQHLAGGTEKGRLIATNNFLNMLGVLVSCLALWVLRDIFNILPDRILLLAGAMTLIMTVCLIRFLPEYRIAAANLICNVRAIGSIQTLIHRVLNVRNGLALTFALVLGALAAATPGARGAEPAPGVYHYTIRHALFGEIGAHTVDVAQRDRAHVVLVDTRVTVEMLFMSVLRLQTQSREVWREGRLVAFESRSDEDGDIVTLSARSAGELLVVEGPEGESGTAEPIALTNPWSQSVLVASVLLEPTSGKLLRVRTQAASTETVEVLGRTVTARKHIVSGDLEAEIWFAEDGTWVRMDFFKAGGRVTIALKSVTYTPTPDRFAIAAHNQP